MAVEFSQYSQKYQYSQLYQFQGADYFLLFLVKNPSRHGKTEA